MTKDACLVSHNDMVAGTIKIINIFKLLFGMNKDGIEYKNVLFGMFRSLWKSHTSYFRK